MQQFNPAIKKNNCLDYLQLDLQGAEYAVLKAASDEALRGVSAITAEAMDLQVGQKL